MDPFDVAIVGTSLPHSILAAALAKSGYKVVHLDTNEYYGSHHASLALQELLNLSKRYSAEYEHHPRYSCLQCSFPRTGEPSPDFLRLSRYFSISLTPSLIPSTGAMIDSLIGSGVSRYGGFKLLQGIGLYIEEQNEGEKACIRPVPTSKEDIFKDTDMPRVDKLKLMRFLRHIASQDVLLGAQEDVTVKDFISNGFDLPPFITSALIHALAFSSSDDEPSTSALLRMRHYMRSAGRYGNSPFLMGHYGGLGEMVQGFCRTSAVHGGMYVLGRKIESLPSPAEGSASSRFKIHVRDAPDVLEARTLVYSPCDFHLFPSNPRTSSPRVEERTRLARGIAIVDFPIAFHTNSPNEQAGETEASVETFAIVFPPRKGGEHAESVFALVTGEGTFSSPRGYYLVYLVTEVETDSAIKSPEHILRPYLSALLSQSPDEGATERPRNTALMEMFYFEKVFTEADSQSRGIQGAFFIEDAPPSVASFTECTDQYAREAERVFWEVVRFIDSDSRGEGGQSMEIPTTFWPRSDNGDRDESESNAEW